MHRTRALFMLSIGGATSDMPLHSRRRRRSMRRARWGPFELSTYRLLQSHLARGLRVMPLSVSSGTPVPSLA